jgi:hypothetical protein
MRSTARAPSDSAESERQVEIFVLSHFLHADWYPLRLKMLRRNSLAALTPHESDSHFDPNRNLLRKVVCADGSLASQLAAHHYAQPQRQTRE